MNFPTQLVIRLICVFIGLGSIDGTFAEIYKWKDKDGNAQFSDKPPPGHKNSLTDNKRNNIPNKSSTQVDRGKTKNTSAKGGSNNPNKCYREQEEKNKYRELIKNLEQENYDERRALMKQMADNKIRMKALNTKMKDNVNNNKTLYQTARTEHLGLKKENSELYYKEQKLQRMIWPYRNARKLLDKNIMCKVPDFLREK